MHKIEYSSLQKNACIGQEQVQVYIYRQPSEPWCLHLVNVHGASRVLDKRFESDQKAMEYFESIRESINDSLFLNDPVNIIQRTEGVNFSLLSPQYSWYRDLKSRELFTLCKFDLVHKYTGLWPAQDLRGHKITGYLYSGSSPAWPHPPLGLPGAPENIEVEFTILPKHIDFYVEIERGLRDSTYWRN